MHGHNGGIARRKEHLLGLRGNADSVNLVLTEKKVSVFRGRIGMFGRQSKVCAAGSVAQPEDLPMPGSRLWWTIASYATLAAVVWRLRPSDRKPTAGPAETAGSVMDVLPEGDDGRVLPLPESLLRSIDDDLGPPPISVGWIGVRRTA